MFGQNVGQIVALTTIMLPPGITKKLALSWPGVGLVVFVYISIIYAPGITPIFGLVLGWSHFSNYQ